MDDDCSKIWLEVTNVRIEGTGVGKKVTVQLKGDKADKEPAWWPVASAAKGAKKASTGVEAATEAGKAATEGEAATEADKKAATEIEEAKEADKKAEDLYTRIGEGLDKKRMVLASLQAIAPGDGSSLEVKYVRVQHTDSSAR